MSNDPVMVFDDENPEWTEEDFARAKRGNQIPAQIRAAFPRTRGRPLGSVAEVKKEQVTVRLDPSILAALRAGGRGWQSRMNEILKDALGIR